MRRLFIVLLVVCLLSVGLLAIGCGSKEVQYISPSGKTYTPEQFRSELQTLYDDYKEAIERVEKDDSDNNMELMVKKFEAIYAFDPFDASAEEYNAKGQPLGLSEGSEERIVEILRAGDAELSFAIENANKYNDAAKEVERRGD